MAKISRGRLDGLHGMATFTAVELHALADEYEAKILDPDQADDIRYLERWSKKMRNLAYKKEKALEHKSRQ